MKSILLSDLVASKVSLICQHEKYLRFGASGSIILGGINIVSDSVSAAASHLTELNISDLAASKVSLFLWHQ